MLNKLDINRQVNRISNEHTSCGKQTIPVKAILMSLYIAMHDKSGFRIAKGIIDGTSVLDFKNYLPGYPVYG